MHSLRPFNRKCKVEVTVHEHILVTELPRRAALVAGLIERA